MSNMNTAILTSLTNGQKYLTDNPAAKTDIKAFQLESDGLDANIIKAILAIKLLGTSPTASSKDVVKYKQDMSDTVMGLAVNALVKSRQLNDSVMINMFTLHADCISKLDKIAAIQKAEGIMANIALKSALLVNIEASEITAGNASITLYDTMKDVPELSIKNKKSFGNAVLKEALQAGRKNITNMKLLIDRKYKKTNPDYKNGFHTAVAIVVLGVRYSPTNITPVDSVTGNVIPNMVLTKENKKGVTKEFVANDEGVVPFKTHKWGDTVYIVKVKGYPDTKVTVHVIRGKTNDITITLKKN